MKSVLILLAFALAIEITIRPKLATAIYAVIMIVRHPVIAIRYGYRRIHDKYIDYKFNRIIRRIAREYDING